MRLTKIYTKTGDDGKSMLANGKRVEKTHKRLEAYGCVDELNAHLGLLRDFVKQTSNPKLANIIHSLFRIQNELFDLGGELATPSESLNLDSPNIIHEKEIELLEKEMDEQQKSLAPLRNFVLPGGHQANSQAHIARTVCRRAERTIVDLRFEDDTVRNICQMYLNRLSDWLFITGRTISNSCNCPEVIWDQSRRDSRD